MADSAGTYWYHSHLGTQRSMGIAGPLIVLPKSRKTELLRRVNSLTIYVNAKQIHFVSRNIFEIVTFVQTFVPLVFSG